MTNYATMVSESLQHPPTLSLKSELIRLLWHKPKTTPILNDTVQWEAYFSYYARECSAALMDEGIYVAVRTYADVLRAARLLEDEATREEVTEGLRGDLKQQRSVSSQDRMIDGSIKLVVRLLTMVNIGALPMEVSGRFCLPWAQGSLREALQEYFSVPPELDPDPKYSVMGTDFTCRNIDRISGIEVVPTDNLVDHLRLMQGDRKVCVFHQVMFLKTAQATQSILPPKLIDETLDTLTLLFPGNNRKSRRWLENDFFRNPQSIVVDRSLMSCGYFKTGHPSRRLEHYHFWRDRLGALAEAVDDATPPTKALLKALRDRKKGDRWLNSWVAMVAIGLTVFFGLVQSIEGAIQVYKAYH
ncbi:hypothetical protein T440DRAFT_464470 [Plenodomus tracheiphilus IPT5]|uniref:Uncharacterized protein n=1 Tax=Plenodomus tracheiphilus IPT5 TaxID=1408161 RepID=A0A6A7BIP9_9PLEO|nr:hypothetical protein T440DRAFT_464470 [Plenodomus tracheiphilus IPT5]